MFKRILIVSIVAVGALSCINTFAAKQATLKIDNLTEAGDTRMSVASFTVEGQSYMVCSRGPGQPPCPHLEVINIPANTKVVFNLTRFNYFGKSLTVKESCQQTLMVKSGDTKVINILPETKIDENSAIYCEL